jgi:hypothetical protein
LALRIKKKENKHREHQWWTYEFDIHNCVASSPVQVHEGGKYSVCAAQMLEIFCHRNMSSDHAAAVVAARQVW